MLVTGEGNEVVSSHTVVEWTTVGCDEVVSSHTVVWTTDGCHDVGCSRIVVWTTVVGHIGVGTVVGVTDVV